MSLTNWEMVCLPRKFGGMGISNLNMVNTALLIRWWWKAYQDPGSLWAITVCRLKAKRLTVAGPRYWNVTGSFFWTHLANIRGLFLSCTTWDIGDGTTISYWMDGWNGPPRAVALVAKELQPFINLREALQVLREINPDEPIQPQNIIFTETEDRLRWILGNNEGYTSKSVYRLLSEIGKIRGQYSEFWCCKIPPSVKIFAFLMLQGKILTREVLVRRGMQVPIECVLCSHGQVESCVHVLFLCSYASYC